MSDCVVRGMKIPPCCAACKPFFRQYTHFRLAFADQNICLLGATLPAPYPERYVRRADNCPLIALPEGHGRLVDADELAKEITEIPRWGGTEGVIFAGDLIDAPTIVPAEKEDAQ